MAFVEFNIQQLGMKATLTLEDGAYGVDELADRIKALAPVADWFKGTPSKHRHIGFDSIDDRKFNAYLLKGPFASAKAAHAKLEQVKKDVKAKKAMKVKKAMKKAMKASSSSTKKRRSIRKAMKKTQK
jgi:hypothetical protein